MHHVDHRHVDCHGVAFETVRIRGWANATNGFVVPIGTQVRQPVTVTANSGAVTVNGAANATVYADTSSRIMVAVPANQIISGTPTSSNAGVTVSVADALTGALEIAVAAGTTGTANLTVTFAAYTGTEYLHARINSGTSTNVGNADLPLTDFGSRGITITGGNTINLKANRVYKLTAAIATDSTGSDRGTFQFFNVTANGFAGTSGFLVDVQYAGAFQGGQPMAVAYLAQTVATQVRVRIGTNKAGTVSSYAATSFVTVDEIR